MASILPWRLPVGWTIFGLLFYPVLILAAWGLALLVGAEVEYPALWGRPVLEVLPLYALTFGLTALAQGGMEEPGWRGLLQPELQKRFSPLVAALIVSVVWSLWHLPLYLNGFYPGDLLGGMLGGAVFRIVLAIFLAWFYNRSGGNLFLMIFLHTCFNVMVNFLPVSDLWMLVLWLVVVVILVIKDKMWRKLPESILA
jgi:membrane protease YdiL (CAAX protease family)